MESIIYCIGFIGISFALLALAFRPDRKENKMEIYEVLKLLLADYVSDMSQVTLQSRLCEDFNFDDYDFIGLECDIENTFEILLEEGTDDWETVQDIVDSIKKAKHGK
jgi:hypothetical protein